MAASLCLHLGLHVSSLDSLSETSRSAKSPTTKDSHNLRVKAFWSSFLLDRYALTDSIYKASLIMQQNCNFPTGEKLHDTMEARTGGSISERSWLSTFTR